MSDRHIKHPMSLVRYTQLIRQYDPVAVFSRTQVHLSYVTDKAKECKNTIHEILCCCGAVLLNHQAPEPLNN